MAKAQVMEMAARSENKVAAVRRAVHAGARFAKGRASVEIAAPATRISLRAPEASIAALNKAVGFALPQKPKTSSTKNDVHALWIGPDEWLIIAPEGSDLLAKFAKVAAFHSAIDVSHRNASLIVSGAGAADVLNAGCPHQFRVEVWRSFATYALDFIEDVIRRDV
jgi:sarcosine oxidase, subunit gamma